MFHIRALIYNRDRETSKRLSAAEAEIPCPISLSEEDVNCADDLLVNAMVWGLLPAYEMENPFLRLFVNQLSKGGYALPHRTKLTKMITKKYEETKEVVCYTDRHRINSYLQILRTKRKCLTLRP